MGQTITQNLAFLFERDLNKLESEIQQYKDDKSLWLISGQISNSAGNLCLHLCGNLQNYIGAILGKSGYVRNRPFEFSAKGLSKAHLLQEIASTKSIVLSTLKSLTAGDLEKTYPEETLGYPMTTAFFMIHLYGHFGYHLGQINYHRRIICSSPHESIH